MDKPRVVAFYLGDEIAGDDPDRAVKLRARELCDPHYMARQSAARLDELTGLFADPAFDPHETGDAARAAGMGEAAIDAAAYVALVIREAELGG